jgi:hypothetical protein
MIGSPPSPSQQSTDKDHDEVNNEHEDNYYDPLTLHAAAALLECVDVGVDTALASQLVPHDIAGVESIDKPSATPGCNKLINVSHLEEYFGL